MEALYTHANIHNTKMMRGFKEIKILGQQNPTGVPKHCTDTMVNRCMTVYYSNLCYHRHRSFVRSIAAFTTLCIILRMNIYLGSFSECSYFCMHFTLELCPLLLQLHLFGRNNRLFHNETTITTMFDFSESSQSEL